MMRNCEVVDVNDLGDAICGKFADALCCNCGIAICERHRETCEICGDAFCCSCLALHMAHARHSNPMGGDKRPRNAPAVLWRLF